MDISGLPWWSVLLLVAQAIIVAVAPAYMQWRSKKTEVEPSLIETIQKIAREQISDLLEENEDLKYENTSLKQENEELLARVDHLEKQGEENSQMLEKLREEVTRMRNEIRRLRHENQELREQMNKQNGRSESNGS